MGEIVYTKKELIDYSKLLSQGIDPITKTAFPSDTLMNDLRIKRYHQEVYELLKYNEDLYIEDTSSIIINKDLTITEFVERINRITKRRLNIKNIANQLYNDGYLKVFDFGNYVSRVPTKEGEAIGIFSKIKKNDNGEYSVNYYNESAQKFIYEKYIKNSINFL